MACNKQKRSGKSSFTQVRLLADDGVEVIVEEDLEPRLQLGDDEDSEE